MAKKKVSVFWHRRDLRLFDNAGLYHALRSENPVVPVFIFDTEILDKLEEKKDARIQFIRQELKKIKKELKSHGSDLDVRYGKPTAEWKKLLKDYNIAAVYTNRDYEPHARERDGKIAKLLKKSDVEFYDFKDHVIFDRDEILKSDGDPYKVFTPFSEKWMSGLKDKHLKPFDTEKQFDNLHKFKAGAIPSLKKMGFQAFDFEYPSREVDISLIKKYSEQRDIPALDGTSRLSMHLRFGTVSIRNLTKIARKHSKSWLNELVWRNFYQIIIWHYPDRIENAFKAKYDRIPWRDDEDQFEAWCQGQTGYPIVDAGMRELNKTGFMHNRIRMVVASFLSKHLLIDWRWGEAYFAKKLLDFELGSNNGGWQWSAGTGCDAAPYFRVFNPYLQTKKFDPDLKYVQKWVPEYQDSKYPDPIVEHKEARQRALDTYKKAIN
jgi:deoxyribodipyrimidine photo-lyase